MQVDASYVKAKARGIVQGLGKLTAAERRSNPTTTFIAEYNTVRKLALQAQPRLRGLLPPEVSEIPFSTYVEIRAYCEEIINLLDVDSRENL